MKRTFKAAIIFLLAFLLLSCGKQNNTINVADEGNVVVSRNVYISEVKGSASVTHTAGDMIDAYEGMGLNDGDDVVVSSGSTLTLDIDSDKHLFADENTHFCVSVEGSEGNTKTIIRLIEGSVLCDINKKLKEAEIFNVQTSTSTLSVRGTVFRVCLLQGKDNSVFDLVEVYDGNVLSNLDNSEESLSLEPGQCALIRENNNDDNKEASFVLAEDIDAEFVKETGLNISLDQAEGGEKGTFKLSLDNASVETLSRLTTIIDEGTELAVEKAEIQEVKEKIEAKKEEPAKTEIKEEVKIEEKKEEVKEVKCTHPNLNRTTLDSGTCVKKATVIEKCPDCGYERVVETDYDHSNHEGTQTKMYDVPSCSSKYRISFLYCESCGEEHDEYWVGPHSDRNGDSFCDECGEPVGN